MGWASTTARIDGLLDEFETMGSCAVADNPTDRRQLSRLAERGDLLRPMAGMFVRHATWERLNPTQRALFRVRALVRLHPGWVFCGTSAALVHGLCVSWRDVDPILVADSTSSTKRLPNGVLAHHLTAGQRASGVVEVAGVNVTAREQTVVDCLRTLDFRGGLVVGDSWLRRDGEDVDRYAGGIALAPSLRHIGELTDLVELRGRGLKGVEQARITAALANGLSENGGESDARAVILEEGYEVPRLQVPTRDPIDGGMYRFDFCWERPDGIVIDGELDGSWKYTDPQHSGGLTAERQRQRERQRESRIGFDGVRVMRFSPADVNDRGRLCRIFDCYGVPRANCPIRTAPS